MIANAIALAVKQQDAATAAIARNVLATAKAAGEMTSRTTDASNEAAVTGRSARNLSDNMTALNLAVEELRHSVIKVLRTSTADVERRQFHRYTVDMAAELAIAGQPARTVRLVDLSEGGAQVCGADDCPIDSRATLRIDGVASPLACVVRATDSGGLRRSRWTR